MSDDDRQGSTPSDGEDLMGDTAASEPLTDRKSVQPGEAASREENGAIVPRQPKPSSGEATDVNGAALLPR